MRTIEVVDYRPEWEKMFQEEAKKIQKLLGKNCIAIYHIGSTSVKGLAAKPIIDIMPVVRDISLVDAHDPEFRALGYDCRGEFGIPGRRFYAKGGDERTHHIHIFEKSNAAAVNRHLAVRDYLRSHPDTAREYAELKKQLAARYPHDNDGCCDGKEAYMKELEQKALKWQEEQDAQGTILSLGVCLGLCIGAALGMLFDNLAFWLTLGIALGVCFGLGFKRRPPKSGQ